MPAIIPTQHITKAPRNLRFVLWLKLSVLAMLAYIVASPFLFHLLSVKISASGKKPPLPLEAVVALVGLQASIFAGLCAWAFVMLGPPLGLDAPVLRRAKRIREILLPAFLTGTVATLGFIAINRGFRPFLPIEVVKAGSEATLGGPLLGISGAFYGGIIEEIIMRLGIMTVLAYGFSKVQGLKSATLISANIGAAVLFGIGHLPAVRALGIPLTPMLVMYIVLGNAVPAIAFGWVYAKQGIETAMGAHFTAGLWLHVVLRSLLS